MHSGDVAIYHCDGGNLLAGNIIFFASASEFEESAFIVAWERQTGMPGIWKFKVLADSVRVPIRNICGAAIAHIGENNATVMCPAAFSIA